MTANSPVFSRLLVSAPNGGGLLAVANGVVHRIDETNTTGLSLSEGFLVRAIQPNSLRLYSADQTYDVALEAQLGDVHDVLRSGDHYYVAGTLGNTVGEITTDGTVVQRWSLGGEEDSYHLNCLARWQGRIVYSAFGDFSTSRGYKAGSLGAGFVKDLFSGRTIVGGLSQPHSLTTVGENLVLADSEREQIVEFDIGGRILRSRPLGGYTRGLCCANGLIYVGLSAARHIPNPEDSTASIVALDAETWEVVGRLAMPTREVYSIVYVDDQDTFLTWVTRVSCESASRLAATSSSYLRAVVNLESQLEELKTDLATTRQALAKNQLTLRATKSRFSAALSTLEEEKNKEIRLRQWEREQVQAELDRSRLPLSVKVLFRLRQLANRHRIVGSLLSAPLAAVSLGKSAIRSPRRFASHVTYWRVKNALRLLVSDPMAFRRAVSFHSLLLKKPSTANSEGSYNQAMSEQRALISVLIVTFDGRHHLEHVIPSLLDQQKVRLEIIVVDNGSKDGTTEWLADVFPQVRVVALEENVGFAEGTNIAAEVATGDYLFLLNNDTKLEDDSVARLIAVLKANPDVAAVSPKLLFWQPFTRITFRIRTGTIILDETSLLDAVGPYKKLIFTSGAEAIGRNQRLERRLVGEGHVLVPYIEGRDVISLRLRCDGGVNANVHLGTGDIPHSIGSDWAVVSTPTDGMAEWIINNAGSSVSAKGETSDIGFGHPDNGVFDEPRDVDALCGCAILLRRSALLEGEPIFADRLFAYFEDTELSLRLRDRGLRLRYEPTARVHHRHASTAGELSESFRFFVTRNRLLFLALHFQPQVWKALYDQVAGSVGSVGSVEYQASDAEALNRRILSDWDRLLPEIRSGTFLDRKRRFPRLAVYNSYWGSLGGGEYHAAAIAECLSQFGPVDLLSEHDFDLDRLGRQFGLELSRCRKVITSGLLLQTNPTATSRYDVFVNSTYGSSVSSNAETSAYIVSFPHEIRHRSNAERQFLGTYDLFLANSAFTSTFVRAFWDVEPHVLYPAVPSPTRSTGPKRRAIISVGRFFINGHNKKQLEMVNIFRDMVDTGEISLEWELILIGQIQYGQEHYFHSVVDAARGYNIRVLSNVERPDLNHHLNDSAIYWHATGLGEDLVAHPDLAEHFGISTVEAMLSGCVPIVIGAGGQPEIVEHSKNGYLFNNVDEMRTITKELTRNFETVPEQFKRLSDAARDRGAQFSKLRMQRQLLNYLQGSAKGRTLPTAITTALEKLQ